MRNLILFILRNHYVILFVLIESLSLFLVMQYNGYQRSCFINSSSAVAGGVNTVFSAVDHYLYLNQKNQELNEELARLRSQMPSAFKCDTAEVHCVKDEVYTQQYEYIPCMVIGNSVETSNNFLTLNVGSKHGIEPGMAVVSASGVVGVVKDVSPNFASVIGVLNQDLNISAMLENNGYFGTLTWDGRDYHYAILKDLPAHIRVFKNDAVITSGYSTIFPKGEPIGLVDTILDSGTNGFITLRVRLAVDFKKLTNVQVVRNLLKKEQLELQNRAENE
ncbi:MAG: rod shape-determining protein MreC [Salinivirgaceae bacterium]|nr:rod shape-determining protein MreC [Salinivirgaceae bacterium]